MIFSLCVLNVVSFVVIWQWISNFFKKRKQCVVVDGVSSGLVDVDSGVPQGTVLGPILFLLHINDLPSIVSSKVRLFADDCLIYRQIKSNNDQIELQRDLNLLESWGTKWGMRFNAAKCNIMRVSRMRLPFLYSYKLSGQVLDEVKDSKYLGVTISDNLDWSKHITMLCWTNWVGLFYQKGARTPDSFFFTKLLTTWHKYLMSIY